MKRKLSIFLIAVMLLIPAISAKAENKSAVRKTAHMIPSKALQVM